MNKLFPIISFVTFTLLLHTAAFAVNNGPIAWWKFEEGRGKVALDNITHKEDAILGNYWYLPGVAGKGLKFDGFTTHIVRRAKDAHA